MSVKKCHDCPFKSDVSTNGQGGAGGRSVFIEVKRPGGRQSEVQKKFQETVDAAGFEYVLAKSVEDVEHLGDGCKQMRIGETEKKRGRR
jgi:hypothetical protein